MERKEEGHLNVSSHSTWHLTWSSKRICQDFVASKNSFYRYSTCALILKNRNIRGERKKNWSQQCTVWPSSSLVQAGRSLPSFCLQKCSGSLSSNDSIINCLPFVFMPSITSSITPLLCSSEISSLYLRNSLCSFLVSTLFIWLSNLRDSPSKTENFGTTIFLSSWPSRLEHDFLHSDSANHFQKA